VCCFAFIVKRFRVFGAPLQRQEYKTATSWSKKEKLTVAIVPA
jgi:hypothetical protein